MKQHLSSTAQLALLASLALPAHANLDLSYRGQIALPGGGEIVSYTKDNYTLATTYFTGNAADSIQGVNLYTLTGSGATHRAMADFSSIFGRENTFSVSSVALDPNGRGFGVATIIPTANTTVQSRLAFFDYNTGSVLHSVELGFHSDSVIFAKDGSRILVANEGEVNTGTSAANDGSDAPGSISVISLSGVAQASDVSSLSSVVTRDFSAPNLGAGASLSGVRNAYISALGNPGNSAGEQAYNSSVPNFTAPENIDHAGIEPEYIAVSGDKAYVSLQENNAIGVYDLSTNTWERINSLGTIEQTIDATNTGSTAEINQQVAGMPMPDTLAVVTIDGTEYLVTANEGDSRVDDRDTSRFGDVSGGDSINSLLDPSLPATQDGIRHNSELGRLNVSRIDGDTDGDGDIDIPVMFGTRSFSIWNAATGELVADSGSLEAKLLELDPTRHNINRDDLDIDGRSDDKGPEPEALSVFSSAGRTFAAIGLERQNGIMLYDISNPFAPSFVDYVNGLDHALISPESLFYIPGEDSPTGTGYLLAGFEGIDGSGENAGIGIFAVTPVPEPSTYGLVGAAALLALVLLRRRSAK